MFLASDTLVCSTRLFYSDCRSHHMVSYHIISYDLISSHAILHTLWRHTENYPHVTNTTPSQIKFKANRPVPKGAKVPNREVLGQATIGIKVLATVNIMDCQEGLRLGPSICNMHTVSPKNCRSEPSMAKKRP